MNLQEGVYYSDEFDVIFTVEDIDVLKICHYGYGSDHHLIREILDSYSFIRIGSL